MMIAQYIVFENSFDDFHKNGKNIYRMVNVRHYDTHTDESAGCVVTLGPAMKELLPEIKSFARCYKSDRVFMVNNNPVHFDRVFSVDSTFLEIFTFPITSGPRENLLRKPNTAVLTTSSAKVLFGDQDPIGKTILQGNVPYVVEAVAADVPENAHLKFDLLISFVTDLADPNYCITCNNRNTYILLNENTDVNALQSKMSDVVAKVHPDSDIKREYKIQPLSDIHLHSRLRFEHEQNGNAKSVLALMAVAILVLFIAWLNYINLTTAMAINRSAEVGIRKVNGSSRKDLVLQFLMESLFVNGIALSFAILLVQLGFPLFAKLVSAQTSFTLFDNYLFWSALLVALIGGSALYGFYPSFVVSSFKPIDALKGKSVLPGGVYSMRLTLVLLQFSFSIILVSGTITMYRQIAFMKSQDLGMKIDETLVIPVPDEYRDKEDGLGTAMSQRSDVTNVTYASAVPGEPNIGNVGGGFRLENAPSERSEQVYFYFVDKNYFDFFEIEFLAGAAFISDQLNNNKDTEIIINDAARKIYGFEKAEDAIGKIFYHDKDIVGRIKGVVRDHHNASLDKPIAPTFFQYTKGKGYYLVKVNPLTVTDNLAEIKATFTKHYPNNPFDYYFLDDFFNNQYNEHVQFGRVFGFFTVLAIVIACLGLFGLTLYIVKIRTKEIALRKVLGATVFNLLTMLSKEYVRLTVVACIVAVPVSYFLIDEWLSSFTYHIGIAWWMFVIPGIFVLIIALVTVSVQSLKVALSKPAENLRNE
jgi:putative ABC transport system permease protein